MADSKLLREQAKRLQAQADVMDAEAFFASLSSLKEAAEVINDVAELSACVPISHIHDNVGEELRQIGAHLGDIIDAAESLRRRAAA